MAAVFQLVIAAVFAALVFALIAFAFRPLIGQLVGWYLENATHGIVGYTIKILGSLWWESCSRLAFAFFVSASYLVLAGANYASSALLESVEATANGYCRHIPHLCWCVVFGPDR